MLFRSPSSSQHLSPIDRVSKDSLWSSVPSTPCPPRPSRISRTSATGGHASDSWRATTPRDSLRTRAPSTLLWRGQTQTPPPRPLASPGPAPSPRPPSPHPSPTHFPCTVSGEHWAAWNQAGGRGRGRGVRDGVRGRRERGEEEADRKSTRLNSSH